MRNGVLVSIIVALLVQTCLAQADSDDRESGNRGNQLLGVRLGIYHFTTDETVSPSEGLNVEGGKKDGFAGELFYDYFFLDQVAFEICFGNSSRGDIRFESPEIGDFIGSVNVYPIAIGVKLTPLSGVVSERYQPYVHGGGSLVITRELFEYGRNIDPIELWDRGSSRSRTDFGWWIGAGFESYVASNICVTSNFKYHSIDYSESIGGYRNHSGYQITFGAAYIFRKRAE